MQSLTLPRRASVKGLGKTLNIAIPVAIAALAASAAYAGADTTFTPALTKFTDFLEGSGGKIITVLIHNRGAKPVTLAERDLAPRDTLAVSIAEPKLEPGASTTAFVVGASGETGND